MKTTTFETAPSLLPLYAKAVLAARSRPGGAGLPDASCTLSPQRIDDEHLTAYRRVCGLEAADPLPPAYLHVLAFPVTLALMSEPAFPFPTIGLVHVANSVSVLRPLRPDVAVGFAVRTADLRPHPAGQQFDILVDATVDDEIVWTERSTYLRRDAAQRSSGERQPRTGSEPPRGGLCVVRVPGDVGRRYAAVSGDRNPIHLYPLTARMFGFRSVIAHGMWLAARTLATLEGRLPDSYTADVAFKTPVFLPATIAVRTTRGSGAGWDLDVRDTRTGKPHLTGAVTFR